jgi:TonB family protein
MTKTLSTITIALLVFSVQTLKAQDNVAIKPDSVYTKVDVLPEFAGGRKALGKYVDGKNHHYPEEARKNNIEGKVMIQFIINADGTPSDFKVIKGIGYGCDEAAVEAFKKMPKWKPAQVGGKAVRFLATMGYLYGL